ncbi:tautomerase family protein [Nostoc parmelioides]|uniref:Tautomerase family protein n=1 Tax=Nostoc parmelioides FACHB-3921 TaxID=2692909 RepID=A0ABR8BEK5_9NOSO|nr:tautomerase family protein [Nostoc parmelioides]MBD2252241.1 tautomerase family protein [Nostoc parmelioides FACHB-3921]
MVQIKVYGLSEKLNPIKAELSNILHTSLIEVLQISPEKRFHRFFPLDKLDFYYPSDRTENYLIIEIIMFEGRSVETKKQLLKDIFKKINEQLQISVYDIEITLFETPKHNWGIRGVPGDELNLSYKVEV